MNPLGIIVIAVGVIGLAVAVAMFILSPDPFRDAAGRLRMFHGEPDSGPHQMPGARDEDRHVIDPQSKERVGGGRPPRAH